MATMERKKRGEKKSHLEERYHPSRGRSPAKKGKRKRDPGGERGSQNWQIKEEKKTP